MRAQAIGSAARASSPAAFRRTGCRASPAQIAQAKLRWLLGNEAVGAWGMYWWPRPLTKGRGWNQTWAIDQDSSMAMAALTAACSRAPRPAASARSQLSARDRGHRQLRPLDRKPPSSRAAAEGVHGLRQRNRG